MLSERTAALSKLFSVAFPLKDCVVGKSGALIGAIELQGRDPDGLLAGDHAALSSIVRAIYGKLHRSITVTQYYAHFGGVTAHLRPRPDPLSHLLSKRRESHLNKQPLCASHLVHYFEVDPAEDLNRLNAATFLKHLGLAPFSPHSRHILKSRLMAGAALTIAKDQVERQHALLEDTMREVVAKWSGIQDARILPLPHLWAHMRFLATLRPSHLETGLREEIPDVDWDIYLTEGDLEAKIVDQLDVLKLGGPVSTYARVAAAKRFGTRLKPGFWARESSAPVRLPGDYLLMTRWKPLTELQRTMLFKSKETELRRDALDVFSLLSGHAEQASSLEKKAAMRPIIQAKMDELGEAENLEETWGHTHSFLTAFSSDPARLKDTALSLDRAATSAGLSLVWETVDLPYAFRTIQPGGFRHSIRNLTFTSSQLGASSLIYRSSVGQPLVADLEGEEAHYVFHSPDGQLFHFSGYVGGRSLIIGIGPVRSGKTFFKNTLATHFLKYGGLYRAIDIDPGTETLARAFGPEAGIFRVSNETGFGFNPFSSHRGASDQRFTVHMTELALQMLKANDDPHLQTLDLYEQEYLDRAIQKTLILPREMRTLTTLIAHMPEGLSRKFARWVHGGPDGIDGRYAPLFDEAIDSIGSLSKRFGVFNLQAIRDDPKALQPVLLELFYRVTTSFEDEALRGLPKVLDVDECHHALAIEAFRDYLVAKIRTWGKWFAGVQLWTQSPEELAGISGWAAIRSAASTFVFMADPKLEESLYRATFGLTAGECEAIKNLLPRREVYIVQPELGVSKTVTLDVEREQYALNTSHPREAALRDQFIRAHGYEKGIQRFLDALDPQESHGLVQSQSLDPGGSLSEQAPSEGML